jgi:hypothetical protein
MTQFQEMSRNYLTLDNHKSKAYHLHTGRQLTGNANSLKETYIFDLILCCYALQRLLFTEPFGSTSRGEPALAILKRVDSTLYMYSLCVSICYVNLSCEWLILVFLFLKVNSNRYLPTKRLWVKWLSVNRLSVKRPVGK